MQIKRAHKPLLGIRFGELRRQRRISLRALAGRCGICRQALSDLENGRVRFHDEPYERLIRFYGLSYQGSEQSDRELEQYCRQLLSALLGRGSGLDALFNYARAQAAKSPGFYYQSYWELLRAAGGYFRCSEELSGSYYRLVGRLCGSAEAPSRELWIFIRYYLAAHQFFDTPALRALFGLRVGGEVGKILGAGRALGQGHYAEAWHLAVSLGEGTMKYLLEQRLDAQRGGIEERPLPPGGPERLARAYAEGLGLAGQGIGWPLAGYPDPVHRAIAEYRSCAADRRAYPRLKKIIRLIGDQRIIYAAELVALRGQLAECCRGRHRYRDYYDFSHS